MSTKTRRRKERQKVSGRAKAESSNQGFTSKALKLPSGVELYKPKPGTTLKISIVPFEAGKGNPHANAGNLTYERTFWTHRSVGSDNDQVICPNKTWGKKCPICEARKKLNYDTHEELIKELSPKQRQLFNVLDHKDLDKGIQLWDISYHLFGKRLDLEIKNSEEDEGIEFFADPEEGSILIVSFAEKTFGGRSYGEAESIRFRPRDPLDDEQLGAAIALDECIADMGYDELKKLFLQTDEEDDDEDEDDEDEKPRSKAKSSAKKPASKPKSKAKDEDEDEEDDDEEWEDDEDEEEEKPKSKPKSKPAAKSKAKSKDEDEEDDEDDSDEDEEEEKPKVKPKAKPAAKSKKKVEEEDDEDDDEWEDDEDEEEEVKPKAKAKAKAKPAAKSKPASKAKKPADDEDEDEDDEDEEEEAPKSKAKSKAKPTAKSKAKPKADEDDDDFDWEDDE